MKLYIFRKVLHFDRSVVFLDDGRNGPHSAPDGCDHSVILGTGNR